MNILIIEDEPRAAERLSRLISKVIDHVSINKCASVAASVNWLKSNDVPDLIFMDIRLEDGECFEIFDKVDVTSPIIFCTAYAEYAVRAFKVNSIDYLLKPIIETELKNAVDKYHKLKGFRHAASNWHILKNHSHAEEKAFTQRLMVVAGNRFMPISMSDIVVMQASEKGVLIETKDSRTWHLDESLAAVCQDLNPAQFVRISRQVAVNIDYVTQLIRSEACYHVCLQSNRQAKHKISRARVKHLKQQLRR